MLPGMRSDVRTEASPQPLADNTLTSDRPKKVQAETTREMYRLPGVHKQSQTGRRFEDLARGFVKALGGDESNLTEPQRAAIRRAAELSTLAEQMRCQALRGEDVDRLALVRLEGQASRAVRALGIETPPKRRRSLLAQLAESAP
jgi:hypothetical protein